MVVPPPMLVALQAFVAVLISVTRRVAGAVLLGLALQTVSGDAALLPGQGLVQVQVGLLVVPWHMAVPLYRRCRTFRNERLRSPMKV